MCAYIHMYTTVPYTGSRVGAKNHMMKLVPYTLCKHFSYRGTLTSISIGATGAPATTPIFYRIFIYFPKYAKHKGILTHMPKRTAFCLPDLEVTSIGKV